ncbi:hypothetical protein MPSEU_000545700 [Mayamaea pseudoterrestris]|nr:hypothetical protein MPSEU_000545700 [Mayamaea pseudoterrestris]
MSASSLVRSSSSSCSSNRLDNKEYYLLTGDVGGTNSRMSLYDANQPLGAKPLVTFNFRNQLFVPVTPENCDDPCLFANSIILPFLKYCWDDGDNERIVSAVANSSQASVKKPSLPPLSNETVIISCLAMAGVVMNNRVKMTNLGNLLVDGNYIQHDEESNEYIKQIKVCTLINDFVAQGYGCLTLEDHEVRQLYGPTDANVRLVGPKVCVGAGTGLGECYLTPYYSNSLMHPMHSTVAYSCFASEGGHVEYAPRNQLESKMWEYLQNKFAGSGRISVERIVSGVGLANIYEFLAQEFPEKRDSDIHAEFEAAGDEKGRVVGVNATNRPGSLCYEAMQIMMTAYGSEVGSCALKFIPTGGIYVTGGLTPKNIHFIEGHDSEFIKAYLHKGRVSPILEQIPLFAVMVEDLGVRGAHKKAQDCYLEHTGRAPTTATGKWLAENALTLGLATGIGFAAGLLVSRGGASAGGGGGRL